MNSGFLMLCEARSRNNSREHLSGAHRIASGTCPGGKARRKSSRATSDSGHSGCWSRMPAAASSRMKRLISKASTRRCSPDIARCARNCASSAAWLPSVNAIVWMLARLYSVASRIIRSVSHTARKYTGRSFRRCSRRSRAPAVPRQLFPDNWPVTCPDASSTARTDRR